MTLERVAIVSDWFAPRRGGIEAQLLDLAERLGSSGKAVYVITSTPGAVDGVNFRVRPLGVAILPREHLVVSPMLPGALRRELSRGYDVVHAHVSVMSPVGWTGAAVARSLGLPTVVTFHSALRAKATLMRVADSILGLGASPVAWTAVSRLVARQAAEALRSDVSVLPNGIDLRSWSEPWPVPEQGPRPRLVSTMRLQRKKRPRHLVRAFAHACAQTRVPARLTLIGDGPEAKTLEDDIAALPGGQGSARIELAGWKSDVDIRAAYAAADGFVLASMNESFGIAALEARAAGLPVIAMRGGPEDFLSHGVDSLLCDDDEGLTHALARFLRDADLRQRLRDHAPNLARFDWPAVIAEHEAVYERARTRAAAAAGAAETRA